MKTEEMMATYAAAITSLYGKLNTTKKEEQINEATLSVELDKNKVIQEADASKLIEQTTVALEKTYKILLGKLEKKIKLTDSENIQFQKFMALCRKIVGK